MLPDGTVTLHDNGTGLGRPPRALRFRVDPQAGTATLLEQITDPFGSTSPCCGSARKLPGGHWVISWGAFPVLPHRLKRSALYAGTDAMHPRK